MRRKRSPSEGTPAHRQLFLQRLDEMIDMRHSLVRLAGFMPWDAIANNLAIEWSAAPIGPGRPAMPLRLMVGLLYFTKRMCNRDVAPTRIFMGLDFETLFRRTSVSCSPAQRQLATLLYSGAGS